MGVGMEIATPRDAKNLRWAMHGAEIFSTCGKAKYFALITASDGRTVATGYNGGPRTFEHCDTGGCPRLSEGSPSGSDPSNCISLHAEVNALVHADHTLIQGGTIYVTGPPCFECAKAIGNSGLARVVWFDNGDDIDRVEGFLNACGVALVACAP